MAEPSLASGTPSALTWTPCSGTRLGVSAGFHVLNLCMDNYDASTYGDRIATVYDAWYGERLDPTAAVDLLASLAGPGGRALELGIGTGRIALPLAERGVHVEGIDASAEMVARLRAKPGGAAIPVHMGDFADVGVEGHFEMVYVPFTTFFALPSQEEQLRCMRNIRSHLSEGGHFVMDAFVPDIARYRNNQNMSVASVTTDEVLLDVSLHDPVAQTVSSSHVVMGEGEAIRLYPVQIRYAWPGELDMMALASGMSLRERFGDYDKRNFDKTCSRHVSIYRAV